MDVATFLVQCLNAVQYGLLLPARIIIPRRVREITTYMPAASATHTAEMKSRYTG